jgi:hypothetical protein
VDFVSPGDDAMCGTPARYVARMDGQVVDLNLADPVEGGKSYSRVVKLNGSELSIQAYDEAGNGGFRGKVNLADAVAPGNSGNQQPGGPASGPEGSGSSACADREPPASKLDGARISRRRVNVFGSARDSGCATDGRAARVQVAISLRVKRGCRFLKRNGRLSGRKRCAKPHFLTAKAGYSSRVKASRFRLKRTRLKLPKGRYTVTARSSDPSRNVESRRTRQRIKTVRVR